MTAVVGDDDFRDILGATRQFVRSVVVPRESEISEQDRIPEDLREQAKQLGLFGYAIPQEWGGLGLDITQDVELALELGYPSLAVRSMSGTNTGIAGQVIVGFGTDEQKRRWLEAMASGEVVASLAAAGGWKPITAIRVRWHSGTSLSGSPPSEPLRSLKRATRFIISSRVHTRTSFQSLISLSRYRS
jgi:hypothetical protein